MPRLPRQKSNTGIYHIMLRGLNRQSLFEDDQDRFRFLKILKSKREEIKEEEHIKLFDIYAWVLMDNHVHLVMRFYQEDSMQYAMKKICVTYSYYYNHKNERLGPVFQDRYKSQPIENEKYLINAVRYVHMNPVKAGICDNPLDYIWSSYREYMHQQSISNHNDTLNILDSETVPIETFGHNKIDNIDKEQLNGIIEFESDSITEEYTIYLEISHDSRKAITDDAARELMNVFGCRSIEGFRKLNRDIKVACIRSMHTNGASISQLSRVTGISRPTIYKMLGILQRDGACVKKNTEGK